MIGTFRAYLIHIVHLNYACLNTFFDDSSLPQCRYIFKKMDDIFYYYFLYLQNKNGRHFFQCNSLQDIIGYPFLICPKTDQLHGIEWIYINRTSSSPNCILFSKINYIQVFLYIIGNYLIWCLYGNAMYQMYQS